MDISGVRQVASPFCQIMKPTLSDHEVVARARRALSTKVKLRWFLLGYAFFLWGSCGYFTSLAVRKMEHWDLKYLTPSFIYGASFGLVLATFGIMGSLFLAKFLTGLRNDFRLQELVVTYHDRLRDLGQLPDATDNPPARAESNHKT